MKKVYYLKTCNTCTRILKELNLPNEYKLQEIKSQEITLEELQHMKSLSGNYESLFNKRAKLYKEMGLKNENLSEKDFKYYLLKHYTFLKRPVIISNANIFIGNSKKTVESLKNYLISK